MNINLHNYEEYFLLYADKELSQEGRTEVEQFIKENPELEEEFEMIINAVIEPDESFQILDKSFLLKSTKPEFINEQNYEEIFVLFYDGELSEEERAKTTIFLNTHPELKDEFLLIGQAKIQGDLVTFPDKKSLLRKEHAGLTGRIILFRSLAAAVVLGFGFWIAIPHFNGASIQPQIAQQPAILDTNSKNLNPTEKSDGQAEKTENSVEEKNSLKSEELADASKKEKNTKEKKTPNVYQKNEKHLLAMNETKQSTQIQPEKRIENSKQSKKSEEDNTELIAQIPLKNISSVGFIPSNEMAHVDVDITPRIIEKNNTAQNVVYLDVDKESSDNYIFYNVPADEFKKTKIGGFLKKIKRVAERNDPVKRFFEMEVGQIVSKN